MKPYLVTAERMYSYEQYFVLEESAGKAISKMQKYIIDTQGQKLYNGYYINMKWSAVELTDYASVNTY